jgi:hypothetical protein
MKIDITKDENGRAVGFNIIRENDDDHASIEQVRDLMFSNNGRLEYQGRVSRCGGDYQDTSIAPEKRNDTVELKFTIDRRPLQH